MSCDARWRDWPIDNRRAARFGDFGTTLTSALFRPTWTVGLLERYEQLRFLMYFERGWNGHQDVVAAVKRSALGEPLGPPLL